MARINLINEATYIFNTSHHYVNPEDWDNALRSVTEKGITLGLISELEARHLRHLGHI